MIIVGKLRRGKSKPIKEPRTAGPEMKALDGKQSLVKQRIKISKTSPRA